jgi:hypothetical protein
MGPACQPVVLARRYATPRPYGLTADAGAQLVAQFFGAALLGDMIIAWSSRNDPGPMRQTLTLAFFVQGVIGVLHVAGKPPRK